MTKRRWLLIIIIRISAFLVSICSIYGSIFLGEQRDHKNNDVAGLALLSDTSDGDVETYILYDPETSVMYSLQTMVQRST